MKNISTGVNKSTTTPSEAAILLKQAFASVELLNEDDFMPEMNDLNTSVS